MGEGEGTADYADGTDAEGTDDLEKCARVLIRAVTDAKQRPGFQICAIRGWKIPW